MDLLVTALLSVFAVGYFVFGGAELGLGMLLPYLGRDRAERRSASSSLRPTFPVSEIWPAAAVAVFVCCLRDLAGELFSGLLPLLTPLLVGWFVRDAAVWWRVRGGGSACEVSIVAGSWAVAGSWGWVLASLLSETPNQPAPLGAGLLTTAAVAALFLAHGLGFAALRLTGAPLRRARLLTGGHVGNRSLLLSSVVMAVLPLPVVYQLSLTEHVGVETPAWLLLPLLLSALPVALTVQMRLWRAAAVTPTAEPDRS